MPVWHASIAWPYTFANGFKEYRAWPKTIRRNAEVLAVSLLLGVGVGDTFVTPGEIALHVRRRLSDAEIEGLPAAWLALPAIDEA